MKKFSELTSSESKLLIIGIIIGMSLGVFAACMNGCSEEYSSKHQSALENEY